MAYVKWTPKEFSYVLKCFSESYSIDEAILKFQANSPDKEKNKERILSKLTREGHVPGELLKSSGMLDKLRDMKMPESMDESLAIRKLQKQISMLEADNKGLQHEVLTSDKMREIIHGCSENEYLEIPKWLSKYDKKDKLTGTPVLFLSDIHFDEVVASEQIGYVNEYNRKISEDRLRHTFEMCVKLCKHYMHEPKYNGVILMLGGDLFSGNIHEELAETNDGTINESILKLYKSLAAGIQLLKDEFGKVFIPCVVGNHGRLHRKPRYKFKVQNNHEWLLYQFLAEKFSDDEDITFHIPESADATFQVWNTSFLLTHGDQFRGGSGIAGIFTPLMLGHARKQKNRQAVKKNFDVMCLGHFHQYIHTNALIVNGSVKGFDEYAYGNNFAYEPPQQAMFIVHPTLGITYRMPIICDPNHGKDLPPTESVLKW